MKKVGQVTWGIFQVFTYILIQLIVGALVSFVYAFVRYLQMSGQGISDYNVALSIILEDISKSNYAMLASCFISFVAAIIYTIWYNKGYVKGKKVDLKKVLTPKNISVIVVLAVCVQIFLITFVSIIEGIKPDWFTNYNERMSQFGIGTSLQSFLYVALLGPIVEELLMRGLVLNQMKRAMPFVAANMVQAFLFAALHGNFVQGSYAFILGLLFGYVYRKYNTIFSTLLFHIAFNASAYLIDVVFRGIDLNLTIIVIIAILSLVLSLFMIWNVLRGGDHTYISDVAIGTEEKTCQEIEE